MELGEGYVDPSGDPGLEPPPGKVRLQVVENEVAGRLVDEAKDVDAIPRDCAGQRLGYHTGVQASRSSPDPTEKDVARPQTELGRERFREVQLLEIVGRQI